MNKKLWLQQALLYGIDQLEIYESMNESCAIRLYESKVDSYKLSKLDGICIRGIINGKSGQVYLEEVNDEMMEEVFTFIKEQCQLISSEEEHELQKPQASYPTLEKKANKVIPLSNDEKINLLKNIETKLLAYDTRIAQVALCNYSEGKHKRSIVNSKGMNLEDESEFSYVMVGLIAKENEQSKSYYDYEIIDDLNTFDVDAFVKRSASEALKLLNSTSIASGKYKMIIKNETMIDLLASLLNLFDGEQAYKGLTLFKDRLNQKVFSDCITIVDEPLLKNGVNSTTFDDEGVACFNKVIVENGVLKSYLHNTISAKLMNTTSTGNGFKASYASPVSIMPTNFYIKNGNTSFDDLVKQMDCGIIVTELNGLHAGLNHVTTSFSLQADGYYVENGKIVKPIDLFTIAANFVDLMNEIEALGSDLKHSVNGIGSCSILFKSIQVSGSNE